MILISFQLQDFFEIVIGVLMLYVICCYTYICLLNIALLFELNDTHIYMCVLQSNCKIIKNKKRNKTAWIPLCHI